MLKSTLFLTICFTIFLQSKSHVRLLINSNLKGAYAMDYTSMDPNPKLLVFSSVSIPQKLVHGHSGKKRRHRHRHRHHHSHKDKAAFDQFKAAAPTSYKRHHHYHHKSTLHQHHATIPEDAFQYSSQYNAEPPAPAPAPSKHHHNHHHHNRRHRRKRLGKHASSFVQAPRFPYQYPADAPDQHHHRHHHHHHRHHGWHHRRRHRSQASKQMESPPFLSKIFSVFW